MGEKIWKGRSVLEIGCGEGELLSRIVEAGAAHCLGIDYSKTAIAKAKKNYPEIKNQFDVSKYYRYRPHLHPDILVLQGVLEHLDRPFDELEWMIDHWKPQTVITSSPCFINLRGVIWMTLASIGAVMSKTDLHFLHPWDFMIFCENRGYKIRAKDCDWDWGNSAGMIEDFEMRIPLALKDAGLPPAKDLKGFFDWLRQIPGTFQHGATMVYRIDIR